MRRYWLAGWEYYLFGPVVLALAALALWLTVSAAYENYRLGQATDQIINVISTAREMRSPPDTMHVRASEDFYKRYAQIHPSETIVQEKQVEHTMTGDRETVHTFLKNPWDRNIELFFYPSLKSIRMEMVVSPSACRKILLFYAKEASGLGLRRVDARANEPVSSWRFVYEEGKGRVGNVLDPSAIISGCGNEAEEIVSLTFYL